MTYQTSRRRGGRSWHVWRYHQDRREGKVPIPSWARRRLEERRRAKRHPTLSTLVPIHPAFQCTDIRQTILSFL